MPTVVWNPNLPPIEMDPDDIRDFKFDFTNWLDGDEVDGVASSAMAEGCTAAVESTTINSATLRVTGPGAGNAGTSGSATLRLVTISGRQSDRSIRLKFKEM